MLTEGEQNQLIKENNGLPERIVSRSYRGKQSLRALGVRKGIPKDELEAQGMLGLVECARRCTNKTTFVAYADKYIDGKVRNYIESWQKLDSIESLERDPEKLVYEWQNVALALYENWTSDPHTPEELLEFFEGIGFTAQSLHNAFLGLTPFERKLIQAYFLQTPHRPLEQLARDAKMSYKRTNEAIYRALGKMRDAIKNHKSQETVATNVIAFPARTGQLIKKSDRPKVKA